MIYVMASIWGKLSENQDKKKRKIILFSILNLTHVKILNFMTSTQQAFKVRIFLESRMCLLVVIVKMQKLLEKIAVKLIRINVC